MNMLIVPQGRANRRELCLELEAWPLVVSSGGARIRWMYGLGVRLDGTTPGTGGGECGGELAA